MQSWEYEVNSAMRTTQAAYGTSMLLLFISYLRKARNRPCSARGMCPAAERRLLHLVPITASCSQPFIPVSGIDRVSLHCKVA